MCYWVLFSSRYLKLCHSHVKLFADVKYPRSVWGVEKHMPCWWPKSQKFDTPWKIKGERREHNNV